VKKIIISYPDTVKKEIQLVVEILASDVDFFHVRKPHFDFLDMKQYLDQIPEEYHYKIVLHSHYQLINEYDLGGINLNRRSLNQICIESESDKCYIEPILLRNNQIEINGLTPSIVSYSAHSFEEIQHLNFKTDYVFLSPIFDSITKHGYTSKFTDHAELKFKLSQNRHNIVALGGITSEMSENLKQIGFYGYARLGDFWQDHIMTKAL